MKRAEAEELLPWFVAGTLSDEETHAVQAFIDSGEISRRDLQELEMFADTIAAQSADEAAYNPAILQSAMAKLDTIVQDEAHEAEAHEAEAHEAEAHGAEAHGAAHGVAQKTAEEALIVGEATGREPGLMSKLLGRFHWDQTPVFAKLAIGAQFAAVLVLGMMLAGPPGMDPRGKTDDPVYTTVSGSASQADLTVAFAADLTELQMRELLSSVEASIVGGPNSLGMYDIVIAESKDLEAVRKLLQDSALTTFVQPAAQ